MYIFIFLNSRILSKVSYIEAIMSIEYNITKISI